MDTIKNLVLISSVFEKIVTLEVLIVIGEDDLVLEMNEIGREKMVVDHLIGHFA